MNIPRDVIDTMSDFSKRESHTQDRYLYQNARKNQIYFSQVICPGYRFLRIRLNVQHIIALEHESAYSPFLKMLSYPGSWLKILNHGVKK